MTDLGRASLQSLQSFDLAPIVCQMIGEPTVEIIDWHVHPMSGGSMQYVGGGPGVFRVTGTYHDGTHMYPWSAVLKAVCPSTDGSNNDQTKCAYWKREVLIYQSNLLKELPGGLVAPRCYGIQEQPSGECWIWLEDIKEKKVTWRMEQHGLAAKHLGQFNGAYLVDRPLPKLEPWMLPGRTYQWLDEFRLDIEQLQHFSETSIGRQWLRGNTIERMSKLWTNRDQLLTTLMRLPECFCHHDAFRRNLMACETENGEAKTVAIDWSYAGPGKLGQEIGITTAVDLQFMEVASQQAHELDSTIFEAYSQGLADAGWKGDQRLVRFGYVATASLTSGIAGVIGVSGMLQPPGGVEMIETILGWPIDKIMDQWSEVQPFLLDLGDEALQLMDEIG